MSRISDLENEIVLLKKKIGKLEERIDQSEKRKTMAIGRACEIQQIIYIPNDIYVIVKEEESFLSIKVIAWALVKEGDFQMIEPLIMHESDLALASLIHQKYTLSKFSDYTYTNYLGKEL